MSDLVGLRVRDKLTGEIVLDITDRLTRVLGTVETGTSPGSIQVPEFANGSGWVTRFDVVADIVTVGMRPVATISGTTLSWYFPSGYESFIGATLVYGVY
ncbi:hypothetical protein [Pseudomonas protegens]|uniref:hypothetical protein n=1 Tax=Pseudomonas protegens TaxID=380021 RepID=UPI002753D033|nr:hypothetical protein [Pseudomonas protegens]MDP9528479.1 hypothetical protein [Pseudomonas protegens]